MFDCINFIMQLYDNVANMTNRYQGVPCLILDKIPEFFSYITYVVATILNTTRNRYDVT